MGNAKYCFLLKKYASRNFSLLVFYQISTHHANFSLFTFSFSLLKCRFQMQIYSPFSKVIKTVFDLPDYIVIKHHI